MTDQYKCQSYYDDNNVVQDCTCEKCGEMTLKEIRSKIHLKALDKSHCAKECGESTVMLLGHAVTLAMETRKDTIREVLDDILDLSVSRHPDNGWSVKVSLIWLYAKRKKVSSLLRKENKQ